MYNITCKERTEEENRQVSWPCCSSAHHYDVSLDVYVASEMKAELIFASWTNDTDVAEQPDLASRVVHVVQTRTMTTVTYVVALRLVTMRLVPSLPPFIEHVYNSRVSDGTVNEFELPPATVLRSQFPLFPHHPVHSRRSKAKCL